MRVVLFGATGMVGRGVLRACLLAADVSEVLSIGRTPGAQSHPKLRELIVPNLFDYSAVEDQLRGYDACFFCLGVSSAGMTERDYARLTYDLTLAAARVLAPASPAMTFVYVSGAGTDSSERGRSMWARVKGRTENALLRLPFKAVFLFRPGVIEPLHGVRSKTRSYRMLYILMAPLLPLARRLWPDAILSTDSVAAAMLSVARSGASRPVLEAREIRAAAMRPASAGSRSDSVDNTNSTNNTNSANNTGGAPALRRGRRWLAGVAVLALLIALAAALLAGCATFGQLPSGPQLTTIERSPEWHDGRFNNPEPVWINLRAAMSRLFDRDPEARPSAPVAVVRSRGQQFLQAPDSGLRVTWFGHSSTLLEIDGLRVLTDPIWSEVASPVEWAGPRRWYAPPIALDDLPPIDVVLISHDHYDHLDYATVMRLKQGGALFVVPLGIGAHLRRWGVPERRIVELDWWQATSVGGVRLTATPARHSSGRVRPATDRTLWAGFALNGPAHSAYYSGDTGFFPALREIGSRLGPFDVTLIESGQYDADWPDLHLGPEQAVAANVLVRGRTMIPVHWALFALAHHPWSEPPERVLAAARCADVRVLVPQPGASIEPTVPQSIARWWPLPPPNLAQVSGAQRMPVVATRAGDPARRFAAAGCDAARLAGR